MTARKNLRRVLLAALLCVLLAATALANEVDTPETAVNKLESAVENRESSFYVHLPDGTPALRQQFNAAIQGHILETESWTDVSPRVTLALDNNTTMRVELRYAEGQERYAAALDAAYDACIREKMSSREKAASIYSYLSEHVQRAAGCDTACEALVEGRADSFGFAAAFRALAQKAGLTCAVVHTTVRAWNTVTLKSGTYYVDASCAGEKGVPGQVGFQYLLFGSGTLTGYEAPAEKPEVSAADCELGFSRYAVCTPLMLTEDGFWLIRGNEYGNRLYAAPYGTNFKEQTPLMTLTGATFSNAVQAAVMADGVVYYTLSQQNDTFLYSWTPGMGAAEARETGLTGNYGLRLEGGTLSLVQDGAAVKAMPLRQYAFAEPGVCYARDAGVPLAEAEMRLLNAAPDGAVIAAFYSAAGQMLRVQSFDAAGSFRLGAIPGGCAMVRLFTVGTAGQPRAAALPIAISADAIR